MAHRLHDDPQHGHTTQLSGVQRSWCLRVSFMVHHFASCPASRTKSGLHSGIFLRLRLGSRISSDSHSGTFSIGTWRPKPVTPVNLGGKSMHGVQ